MKFWFPLTLVLTFGAFGLSSMAHADDSGRVKAREHFKQGAQLFDERRFADALDQFERSYSLFAHYSTLFNIGQVRVALGHPVQAVEAFEKFLAQGGAAIPPEQRQQVEAELKAQQQRIGDIKVAVSPNGAEIRVDGDRVGKAPMSSAVRVAAGHHRVEAMLEGYRTEQREVEVAGLGHVELQLRLESLTPVAPVVATATPVAAPAPVQAAPATPAPTVVPTAAPTPAAAAPAQPIVAPPQEKATSSSTGTAQRVFGYLAMAGGLVAGGVGTAFAIDGQNKHNTALDQWYAGQKDQARITEDDSVKEKTKGFVVIGAGGALALTGAILLITAPSSPPRQGRVQFAPWIGANTGGASLAGRF